MGKYLNKIGAFAYEHKWRVLIGWLLVLGVLGFLAVQFIKPTSNAISIPGTAAQVTLDRVSELFPEAGRGSGRVVFETPKDSSLQEYRQQIETGLSKVGEIEGVVGVVSPFDNERAISSDKTIAYAQLQLQNGNGSISKETTKAIAGAVESMDANGLTVAMGGDVIDKAPGEILGVGEVAGVLLALVVLVLTLGSLVAAGMPIIIAIITIGVSMAGLFSLSEIVDISATTPVLAVMLGLAVGIDYSLFIISKYKHYLLEGFGYKVAAGKAVGTAGSAVVFAAATVVIALAALTIVRIPFMTTMGLTGAATVGLAAIVAVTLIPALLGFAKDRVFIGKTKHAIAAAQAKGPHHESVNRTTIWFKWGKAITKRPTMVLIGALLLVGAIAWPAQHLQMGLPTDEYAAQATTERQAYDTLAKGFGPGFNGPLLVVAEGLPAVSDADRAAVRAPIMQAFEQQVAKETAAQQAAFGAQAAAAQTPEQGAALQQAIAQAQQQGAVMQQQALVKVNEQVEQYAKLYQLQKVAARIGELPGVDEALPALATADGTKGMIQVIATTAPSDAKTLDLITHLRDPASQRELTGGSTVSLAVTGSTALEGDINSKLASALPQYLGVVVGLSLVLLVVAFRSILVPIKATLGFLLSVLAMFGALVAVFQWGWFDIAAAPGPIVSFIPIIATGILFGLAMDYEFFLVSSMREEYERTGDAKRAVVDGFGVGSKVVTAAGVIMVAVFAGFITNHDATVQAIGFGLAVGILVDAFVVRMTIVPAVMTLLGERAWWLPKWLDKILPHVSIEGEHK